VVNTDETLPPVGLMNQFVVVSMMMTISNCREYRQRVRSHDWSCLSPSF